MSELAQWCRAEVGGLFILDAGNGDASTMIGLATALTSRGHACHVLAAERFRAAAQGRCARFCPVDVAPASASGAGPARELLPVAPGLAEYFARLDRARATVLVNTDHTSASNSLAELHGIRTVRLYLTPTQISSRLEPTWPLRARTLGHLGQTFAKYQLPQLLLAANSAPRALSATNRSRLLLGLPPLSDLRQSDQRLHGHVAAFPEWYASRGVDWPRGLECVGFALPRSEQPVPEPLAQLVARAGRVVVFLDITGDLELSRHAAECCRELALPGVLLGASATVLLGSDGLRREALATLDLDVALQHAALLVHAGDTAASARALRAGVPQVFLPVADDQRDNAQRAFNLGVARYLAACRANSKGIVQAARAVLENVAVARSAGALSERVASQEVSVRRAAALLEEQLASARVPHEVSPRALPVVAGSARTVMFIAFSEPGHVAVPLALARRLSARGDRVVFACMDEPFAQKLSSLGYEAFDLSRPPDWAGVGAVAIPSASNPEQLRVAVSRLVLAFDSAVERYRPSVVLIDTLLSSLGIMAQSARVPWAIYETDLMREYDPSVPPRGALIVPGREGSRRLLRNAWRALLQERSEEKRTKPEQVRAFPRDMIAALQHRCAGKVRFERQLAKPPVARAPKLVFSPREFDFPRERTACLATWVGSCIDEGRCEPGFPWHGLPSKPFVYCAFGTQSLRDRQAPALLQVVVDVFARRDDLFLVLVCPEQHRPPAASHHPNLLVVNEAPQLALLRRASLAITHAGFNSVKECAAYGVPMIALPLSQEQPRNAALVEFHGLGVAIDTTRRELTASALDAALTRVSQSAVIRENCRRIQRHFQDPGFAVALQFIDDLAAGKRAGASSETGAGVG